MRMIYNLCSNTFELLRSGISPLYSMVAVMMHPYALQNTCLLPGSLVWYNQLLLLSFWDNKTVIKFLRLRIFG